MLQALHSIEPRRGLLLATGLLLGVALALAMAGLSWETGALGLGIGLAALVGLAQTRTLTKDQIKTITYKSGMQSGRTLYYDLQLTTTDGKSHSFGKRVPSQPAAQAIADDSSTGGKAR